MSHIEGLRESIAFLSSKAVANLSALSEESHHNAEGQSQQASKYTYANEIQRLQIWNGEHAVLYGRLDHKLSEASPLRDRILTLLTELSGLSSITVRSTGTSKPEIKDTCRKDEPRSRPRTELLVTSSVHDKDDQSVDGATSSSIDTDMSFPDSLPDLPSTRAHDIITGLFELGPTLLDPAPHDRLEESIHPGAAQHDLDHVRAKFPRADESLIQRLGLANWERRVYLRKLRLVHEEHRDHTKTAEMFKTAEDLSQTDAASISESSEADICSSSDAASRASSHGYPGSKKPPSMTASLNLTATASTRSDFHFSTNETRSTARTDITQHIASKHDIPDRTTSTKYVMPPPPCPNQNYTGEDFLCPYCFRVVPDVKSSLEWKKHVFEDLQPYMCTYTSCMSSAKTYSTVHSWWQHEVQRHRILRSWKCSPCEQANRQSQFETSASFDAHIIEHHVKLTRTPIQNIRDVCQRETGVQDPRTQCPLCKETILCKENGQAQKTKRTVRKHVSNHLEQLAFFVAIPAGQMVVDDDESEFQDDSDSEGGLKTEIESIVSFDTHMSKKHLQSANVQRFMANQEKTNDGHARTPSWSKSAAGHDEATTAQDGSIGSKALFEPPAVPPAFPMRLLMHPPNEHFYARQNLLADADTVLRSSGSICLFYGVGGVGKTLAAVQYIYTHQDQFDAIFWLQADTAPRLSDSYLQMAMALGLSSGTEDHNHALEKGRNWLQGTDKRWLLVFDNALHWIHIARYLPNALKHSNGSVLITTQAETLIEPSRNVTKIRLNPLYQQAGSEMLLSYLGRDTMRDPEKDLAKEVSVFVGGLPVAIAHVAGYVTFSEITLEELIETFREWRKRTGIATDEADDLPASFREASFSYDETLAMVWEVTLRELTEDARDLLNILAHLNCEAVPQRMLWALHDEPSLRFLDPREKVRSRRTKESLIKRRLVQTNVVDGEPSFAIHRSLQRGIREKLSKDKSKQQIVFDQAVALVREVFPRSNPLQQPMPDQWSECQRLLPHLHALHDVYHRYKPAIKGSTDFAQLLSDAGMDQFERGITHEGLLLTRTAEEVLDACSPHDHQVMRADIHAMIAIMYDNTGIGERKEGLKRRKIALDIRKKIFEAADTPRRQDEMLLYNSWMEYAISLLHYHRFEDAEPIIENCLRKFQQWGSEDEIPFEYAKYYNKIALVRMYQGRFEEAVDLATQGVHLMQKTGYSLFESRFKFDLACIILQSGDLNRSLGVHEGVLNQRLEKLGQTNELTLHSMYAIGAIHELLQDFDQAEHWFRRALRHRRSLTSWPDEAFARAQFHLSEVLVARGNVNDIEEAEGLREQALKVLHRLLPFDHPPELENVTDEAILFDHLLPISPGGPRFTGQRLLQYFMHS